MEYHKMYKKMLFICCKLQDLKKTQKSAYHYLRAHFLILSPEVSSLRVLVDHLSVL